MPLNIEQSGSKQDRTSLEKIIIYSAAGIIVIVIVAIFNSLGRLLEKREELSVLNANEREYKKVCEIHKKFKKKKIEQLTRANNIQTLSNQAVSNVQNSADASSSSENIVQMRILVISS